MLIGIKKIHHLLLLPFLKLCYWGFIGADLNIYNNYTSIIFEKITNVEMNVYFKEQLRCSAEHNL